MSRRHHIVVTVVTRYLPQQSEPERDLYAFAYTITIKNQGEVAARLTHRHWLISHGNGHTEQVDGEGVVGEQPRLLPGESHQYSSGAMIQSVVGSMQGSYDMLADDGTHFTAEIPEFTLSVPRTLH
jgi:ApaG protein